MRDLKMKWCGEYGKKFGVLGRNCRAPGRFVHGAAGAGAVK